MLDGDGSLLDFMFIVVFVLCINIVGMYFWGYVNFYIFIFVVNVLDSSVFFGGDYIFNFGVEIGLWVYFWCIEEKKFWLFVGVVFVISDW